MDHSRADTREPVASEFRDVVAPKTLNAKRVYSCSVMLDQAIRTAQGELAFSKDPKLAGIFRHVRYVKITYLAPGLLSDGIFAKLRKNRISVEDGCAKVEAITITARTIKPWPFSELSIPRLPQPLRWLIKPQKKAAVRERLIAKADVHLKAASTPVVLQASELAEHWAACAGTAVKWIGRNQEYGCGWQILPATHKLELWMLKQPSTDTFFRHSIPELIGAEDSKVTGWFQQMRVWEPGFSWLPWRNSARVLPGTKLKFRFHTEAVDPDSRRAEVVARGILTMVALRRAWPLPLVYRVPIRAAVDPRNIGPVEALFPREMAQVSTPPEEVWKDHTSFTS